MNGLPNRCSHLVLSAALGLGLAGPAHAGLIFDNTGGAETFDRAETALVSILGAHNQTWGGSLFTASESGYLDRLEIPLQIATPAYTSLEHTFRLYSGTTSALGDLLEVFEFDVTQPSGQPASLTNVTASGNTLLEEGTTYWLIGTAGLSLDDFRAASYWFRTTDLGGRYQATDDNPDGHISTSWQHMYRVYVTDTPSVAVPEPGTLGLVGAGILLMLGLRRRQTRHRRISR
ncbi:hypothetical protein J2T57_001214 [Natronocella acetinitrilica]|uniref:Ice-binding protein C-terminal domain-containing protein n=1 Tax=Natronocella acetinitrilica TaxID=414046 RepID=A0AAE3G5A4_9GAMM|nr:PEP-CTERM sorting domain-containing protein [Natronocella acetinitrilica]MCP1674112.1 hypothetical protein [Natronocella acetinitrilica]